MKQIIFISISQVLLLSLNAQAMKCSATNNIEPKHGKIEVNAPGEPDLGEQIRKDAKVIAEIAADLGLATPDHQLNVVPSGQLDILAGTGGHPAPHFLDGADIANSGGKTRGVLEFVTAGCPTCRAFYSASTPLERQRAVIMHVAGHLDMSATSLYQRIRPGDGPLASYQLAKAISKAYSEHDHDEVSLFFQFLKSFHSMQDYTSGTFDDPALFSRDGKLPGHKNETRHFWDASKSNQGGLFDQLMGAKKPDVPQSWTKTKSILQAMTELLPADAPEWQHSILRLYEQSVRAYPAIFQTKIMNEGWATLQHDSTLVRHTPWTDSADLVKYAQLMSGVAHPGFENPYWLGLTGWTNLYNKFMRRPELQGLSEKEKDRKFVTWAREFYAEKNDSEWAKLALDEEWIEKNNFLLYRETKPEEVDPNLPKEKQKFIALSRNWKRIRNFLISKYVNTKFNYFPSLSILNPTTTPGRIVFEQDKARGLPLDILSAAKTLFVVAQVHRTTAQVNALFSNTNEAVNGEMQVTMSGKVTLKVEKNSEEELRTAEKMLETAINNYKASVLESFHDELTREQMEKWGPMTEMVSEQQAAPSSHIVQYAPFAGPAVREYLHVVEKRLRSAVTASLTGKAPARVDGSGATVRILPEVPSFQYDGAFQHRLKTQKPVGPVDRANRSEEYDFNIDENGTMIGRGPLLPGDKWGPKQDGGKGQGESEKSEEQREGGEDGDPADQESDGGKQPAKGHQSSGDPADLKLPLQLYGELLGEILELPNIRRTEGKVSDEKLIRRGSVKKPAGNVLWDLTMIEAIEKARAIRRGKGLPFDSSVPVADLIREALPLLEPGDIRVSATMKDHVPDFDAVLVVNIDMTASMMGDRILNAKNLVLNMEALLKAKYKNVTIVFVGFDGTARELTRKQAFSQFFGGGTSYEAAAKMDREILVESGRFPSTRYNKYIVTIGDAETTSEDARGYTQIISEMREELQYAGLAVTNESKGGMTDDLVLAHTQLQKEWPWLGVTFLHSAADMFKALKELFTGGADQ